MGEAGGRPLAVVVEDHEATRDGVVRALGDAGFEVGGTAGDAAGGFDLVERESPTVCVIDLVLPDGSGSELIRRLKERDPGLGVVAYTGVERSSTLTEALDSGARGLVLKGSPLDELVAATRAVAKGSAYIDPRLHAALLGLGATQAIAELSPREREVLDLLADGLKGVEIAERLGVSPETIRTHVQNAMNKLDARTRAHAVAIVLRQSADLGPG